MGPQSVHGIVANTKLIGDIELSHSLFEQNGGTYSFAGDYHIPNLATPSESEHLRSLGRVDDIMLIEGIAHRWYNYVS